MSELKHLFEKNQQWAVKKTLDFFRDLAKKEPPKILWIGCVDSRVPPEVIMELDPGQMFVHRNVANRFSIEDPNSHAALQAAVDFFQVEHIIVCGHYGCNGIAAAIEGDLEGPLGRWLAPVKAHHAQSEAETFDDFIHLNVLEQIEHLSASPLLKGKNITLHGWVYDIATGLLKELTSRKI